MKFVRVALLLALVLGLFGAVKPVAAITYTYTSGYQVQNLANTPTNITIDYYTQQQSGGGGGVKQTTASETIPALGSKTYFPIHVASGFSGSVVISSDQPLASIVNLVVSGIGNASYIGSSNGSGTMYLPLLMRRNSGITTWYSLQNAGSSDASVNVAYSDGTTRGPITIKPNASFVFDQDAETTHTKTVFAATVTSTQPVVAVVVQEGTVNKNILATSGFSGGEANAFMPLINANNSGYVTGTQIQNIGAAATEVTVTYTPVSGAGNQCTEKRTIQPGASETFALYSFAGVAQSNLVTTCTKARFVGAAQVTTNSTSQPLVATVNQANGALGGAYSSFAPATATAKVVLPLIMDRNSGWWTGFNLVNVGSGSTTVTCTFTGTTYTVSKTLATGEVLNDLQINKIRSGYVGSGTCTATGAGAKIVAVVNEIAPGSGDILLVYEGLNVIP